MSLVRVQLPEPVIPRVPVGTLFSLQSHRGLFLYDQLDLGYLWCKIVVIWGGFRVNESKKTQTGKIYGILSQILQGL